MKIPYRKSYTQTHHYFNLNEYMILRGGKFQGSRKESLYGSLKWEVKLKWHHEDIGYEPNCNEGKREQRRDRQECGRLILTYLCKTK